MRTVTVKKDELLAKVTANREAHREVFLSAQEGYRRKFIEVLEQRLEDARNGKHFDQRIGLVEPVDKTQDYDQVISMLEMSVDEEIELDATSYACYVLDRWAWKDQFMTSNAVYTDAI